MKRREGTAGLGGVCTTIRENCGWGRNEIGGDGSESASDTFIREVVI